MAFVIMNIELKPKAPKILTSSWVPLYASGTTDCKTIAKTPPPANAIINACKNKEALDNKIKAKKDEMLHKEATINQISKIVFKLYPDFFKPAPLAIASGILAIIIPTIIEALTILFSSKLIPILADSGIPSIKAPTIRA